MSITYIVSLSEEEKKYVKRLIESDKDQDTCEMACDLLLRLSGLAGIEGRVIEETEVIPRQARCENEYWEFQTLKSEIVVLPEEGCQSVDITSPEVSRILRLEVPGMLATGWILGETKIRENGCLQIVSLKRAKAQKCTCPANA